MLAAATWVGSHSSHEQRQFSPPPWRRLCGSEPEVMKPLQQVTSQREEQQKLPVVAVVRKLLRKKRLFLCVCMHMYAYAVQTVIWISGPRVCSRLSGSSGLLAQIHFSVLWDRQHGPGRWAHSCPGASRIWAEPATVCTEDSGAPGTGVPSPALHHHGQFHLFPLLKYPFLIFSGFLFFFLTRFPPPSPLPLSFGSLTALLEFRLRCWLAQGFQVIPGVGLE